MHSIKSAASLWLLRATKRPPFEKVLSLLQADTGTAGTALARAAKRGRTVFVHFSVSKKKSTFDVNILVNTFV